MAETRGKGLTATPEHIFRQTVEILGKKHERFNLSEQIS
jgi:hypothetical protein